MQLSPTQARRGGLLPVFVDDVFQLIQQLLRAANAERRYQQRAAVAKGVFADGLQPFAAGLAAFVQPVPIRAFNDQNVCPLRALQVRKQRRIRGTQISAEHHPHGVFTITADLGTCGFQFQVSTAQNVACGLQAQTQVGGFWLVSPGFDDAQPAAIGHGNDLLLQLGQHTLRQGRIPREAYFQRIFQHHGQ